VVKFVRTSRLDWRYLVERFALIDWIREDIEGEEERVWVKG
jgi:hypothetical protein